MNKVCVVLGSTGQDGSFLVGNLLKAGHRVICGYRKTASDNTGHLSQYLRDPSYSELVSLWPFDLNDHTSIYKIIAENKPDWLFNEADQDHVGWSYDLPSFSVQVTTDAVTAICEAVKLTSPKTKLFMPVSSNIFGNAHQGAVDSSRLVSPVSPYGIAKAAVLHLTDYYRSSCGLNIVTGILFNHESYKRSEHYLTKKLALAVSAIEREEASGVAFGDLDTEIDWGCADEFTSIFCKLMGTDFSGNVVIGTGNLTRVGDLVDSAFSEVGLDAADFVTQDPRFMRPVKMAPVYADTTQLEDILGSVPQKNATDVIREMISWERNRLNA